MKINGWIFLDKPYGMSSAKAVDAIKKALRKPPYSINKSTKIGHGGTLDPLATGILPVALGEATKTVNYAMDMGKEYIFTVKWGAETTTDDIEGEIVRSSPKKPGRDEIIALLPQFTGEVSQMPPAFSALKVDGKRAYELARSGQEVNLQARKVNIYSLELLAFEPEHARFRVKCGKGTYIRSIARDLGRVLGCYGHVIELIRSGLGKISLTMAISLENLENVIYKGDLQKVLMPIDAVLDDIPAIKLAKEQSSRLVQGQVVRLPSENSQKTSFVRVYNNEDSLVAMASQEDGLLRPLRIFNT